MANVIKLKQGSGSNPQASDLVLGELAIRTDGTPKLFALNDAGNVVGLGGAPDDGSITSAKIADGAIVNADINASAAIAGSKISPNFGSQDITTTGELSLADKITITGTAPKIVLTDSDHNSDFRINVGGGVFQIEDATNSFADRFTIASDGTTTVAQNLDVGAGIDVTGNIETTGMLKITSTAPHIDFIDTNGAPDFRLLVDSNYFQIYDINNAETRFKINTDGHVDIAGNLDCAAGVDVTGNITVSGTVDGVDIAARDTLFGGLTSSSGVLTNGVTATTQSASDNSTKVATTAYTDTAISNLVDSSPSTLNTLNELAAALGDDANFSTTVTNSIATKMPLAGGTFSGNIITRFITPDNDSQRDLGTTSVRWRAAYVDNYYGSGANLTNLPSQTDNNFTNADHSKLDGIEANAINASNTAITNKLPLAGGTLTGGLIGTTAVFSSTSSAPALEAKGDGSSQDGYIQLNCSQNSHGIKLASPAHSAGASYTFTFPSSIVNNGVLKTDGSGNTSFSLVATANVADDAITFAKMQNIGTPSFLGRNSSGTGNVENLSVSDVRTMLNVEDGATADQSASEILTLIKTVDGAGSGLDADTLDGISSASFLRSDANDTTTGNLTISKAGATLTIKDTDTINSTQATLNFDDGNNQGVALKHVEHDGDLPASGYGLILTGSSDNTQFPSTGTLSLTVLGTIYAGGTTVGSVHRVLTVADEGSGNGIDADTLDGQHGSYYLDYSNFTNTPTVPTNNNQLTNGAGYITSAALAGASDGGNAALLDGIDSTQFLRSDADDTTSGTLGITSNSSFPLTIDGNADGKILLKGSNNPYIQFQEGTTSKAYIQWHSSGHIKVHNTESGEELRIGSGNNGLQYEVDGSVKTVYHTGNLPTIPTNNNQLTNGAGYITSASFSDVAGGGTFTGDVSFSGGASAVSIAANSDIRLNAGSWTGEASYKIQAHSGTMYLQAPAFIFRDDGGSNRWSITSSGHLVPSITNTYDLGASGNRIQNLYVNDMHFSNEGKTNDVDGSWGDWTLQEGEEDIFMINNRSGKKFKIAMIPV